MNIKHKIILKYCLLFITALCFSGCYSSEIISKDPAKTNIKEVRKINLKDGTTVDFSDKYYQNILLRFDSSGFEYKNLFGISHTISKDQITQVYEKSLNTWKSFFFILGAGIGIAALLLGGLLRGH